MKKTILILALPEDVHARSVAREAVQTLGCRAIVLDTADYPRAWSLSQTFGAPGGSRFSMTYSGETISDEALAGVWWRRPRDHEISAEVVDSEIRRFCGQEARSAFRGWLISLGARVINPPAAEAAASYKPYQLEMAARWGLRVPATLVTNDPDEVGRLSRSLGEPLVFKILTSTTWQFAETREFKPEHEPLLSGLRHAPAIFQRLIPGLDIRVTVVDRQAFPVAITADHPGARLDWRLDGAARCAPHRLPLDVEKSLVRLVASLGLRYGAVDLRLTEEGEYYFLEVNPSGQFLFCDIHAGQKISLALAEALAAGAGPGGLLSQAGG